ncbi:PREDICTED: WD repeat-containing protein 44 [Tarenaya hassleriana]|uniref:WD repeat-containing protein 44 n=1 Tax=Tarenaya hassleriana TaxID=28532 RepID=UPI00053C7597|nr:PREDICTED: WD repeat-containing protein 44 [Tarenaya hassleriana]
MDHLGREEDLPFFDANEEMASNSTPSGSNDSNEGSFLLDVWNGCPESVMERRRKFLEWMGVDECRVRTGNSVSVSNAESEFDIVPVHRDGDREFSSSSQLSSFSSSSRSGMDLSGELSLRIYENARRFDGTRTCSSSMASCSDSRCYQGKESEKQRSNLGLVKSFKKGWFCRLQSMGCTSVKEVESCRMRASGYGYGYGYGEVVSGRRICRVKVKHCKKKVKELSALYQIQDIKAHDGSITTMKFSDDGKYLASGGEDGVVRMWKVRENKRSKHCDCPEIDPSCMYFEVDDLSQLKPVSRDEEKTKMPKSLRKTSDSACVVFPSKVFRVLEKPLHEFRGHKGKILDISWSKDNYLLSASIDNTVRLWRNGSNNCLGVFRHKSYVTSVQFNPANEKYFVSGSTDGKVRIWEIPGCKVVDWADTGDIISAVCYSPDGWGGIIGFLSGDCRFFDMSGEYLELASQIHLLNKKKSSNKRITGFKFLPRDPSKVLVVSADSQVRTLHGNSVVRKYKSLCNSRSLTSVSLTSDGKHIVSACEDSNVYIWNSDDHEEEEPDSSQMKKIKSFERFSTNASVATTWSGCSDEDNVPRRTLPFSSPSCLSLSDGFAAAATTAGTVCAAATWPEENLPASPLSSSKMHVSEYKFLKASYQKITTSSLAWGMVIITGGWDGRIRTFQNFGLPVVT